jgi:rhodanese-related sulfurtransferase
VVGAALVLLLAACSGSSDPDAGPVTEPPAPTLEEIDVDEFATRLAGGDGGLVINVHVPYEGEIAGTDLFIPYDRITESSELPSDKDAPLLLYCRSDRMSREAGEDLVAAGYTNVAHLVGGFVAWEASGREVVVRETEAQPAE